MKREATVSICGSYRYDMTRTVEPGCTCDRCAVAQYRYSVPRSGPLPFVLWVLCNPSIADAEIDDPTERRGWGFTSSWGYNSMVFVNVSAYRSTNPKYQRVPGQLQADHNEGFILRHAIDAAMIVCAWGNHAHRGLAYKTQCALQTHAADKVYHMGLTKLGQPKHPLYLSKETKPQLWTI
jgi:hypothetical protein